MDPTSVALLVAGALLLVGFVASLAFERFRIPDFFVLILLGIVLGHVPIEPFGASMVVSLQPVLPSFTQLTLAIILFEGGLTFRLGVGRLKLGVLLGHIAAAMALSMALIYLIGLRVLGLDQLTAMVVGAAFAGPSASIALSFASRLSVRQSTKGAIVLEGVLTNAIAAVLVIFLLNCKGTITANTVLPYAAQGAIAALGAIAIGFVWHAASERLESFKFIPMATMAMAIVVYAAFQGFVGENGALAAFAFGTAVGYRWPSERSRRQTRDRDDVLKGFQAEVSFALRTFFFTYLGLLITLGGITMQVVLGAVALTLILVVARIPSSLALGRVFLMTPGETLVVVSTVGRGMTDVILVLLAIQSGVLPLADSKVLVSTLTLVVLMSAAAAAALLFYGERQILNSS